MKYSKSALGLLNSLYRSVLKKCLMINLGLFALAAVAATPAMAYDIDDFDAGDGEDSVAIVADSDTGSIYFFNGDDTENLLAIIDSNGNVVAANSVGATHGLTAGKVLSVGNNENGNLFEINAENGTVALSNAIKASLQTALNVGDADDKVGYDDLGFTIGADEGEYSSVAAYVGDAISNALSGPDKKLSDYGIGNAYTKKQVQDKFVAKVDGKGLSTNDYTDDDKAAIAGLQDVVGDEESGLVADVAANA